MGAEPEMMHVEAVDREGLRRRVKDPFYQNTISILAMENDQVLGRIEYHFTERTERIRKDKRTKNNGKIIFPLWRDGQFEIC